VTEISKTFYEYQSDKATEQIFVQYMRDSDIVARVELVYAASLERTDVMRALSLPLQPTASQINSKGNLEEYFSAAGVVVTYASAETTNGVRRIGYYSRELFESAAAKVPRGSALGNNPNNSKPTEPVQPTLSKYDDVIASARGALQTRDFQTALKLGQQAVAIDPSKSDAYEIVGITYLYGMGNVSAAEAAYRAALQRGGNARFSATHDHDGFFQTYCQGTFALSRLGVAYFSNDGRHQFNVTFKDMREVGMNKLIGGNFAAFHVKFIENGKNRNYNFAPGTFSPAETKLILGLLRNP
jgi:tetratricopeptide (TPR) repeat protein